MTAVLPGGVNGGAKVFVLELLRRLAENATETEFILLTRLSAHEELAKLDRSNVRRIVSLDDSDRITPRSIAAQIFRHLVRVLPRNLEVKSRSILHQLKLRLRRKTDPMSMTASQADLLFCPFTWINYSLPEIPSVAVFYDLQHVAFPSFFPAEEVLQRDARFFDTCRRATILVTISEYSRQTAISYGEVDPERIKTIYLQNPPASEEDLSHDIGRPDFRFKGEEYLLYPANFWQHKNHERLFSAFKAASDDGLPAHIRLVCTGAPSPRQALLKKLASDIGMDERIVFTDYVSTTEMSMMLANSRGVIFPSLYEGFGLPVIEAMAAGIPIACSNVTSLPEVAGGSAILFDPTNPDDIRRAILTLVADRETTSRLVELGKVRAADFSSSHIMAKQYWEIFQQAAHEFRM